MCSSEKPLVSVIIPNYNHAKFLDERIQSVLHQTYQNFELIILDDKSSDNSVEVINQYKDDPHVSQIIVNEVNSGSSFRQWHKGFEVAKGDIVWIAESDDACDVTLLEKLVRGYVEHDAVMAFCKSYQYDVQGKRSYYELQDLLADETSMPGKAFISEYMISKNVVANASSVIFNRAAAMSVDKQYMTMRGEGDFLFWIELMEKGNVYFCSERLNYFRFHETNTTQSLSYRGISQIEHKIVFDYLVKNGYLKGSAAWREKQRCIRYFSQMKYESFLVRRKVLNVWDKNRLGRLYYLGGMVKNGFLMLFRDLW